MTHKHNHRGVVRSGSIFEPLESRQLFAAGALDTSFSGDGRATLSIPGASGVAADVAVQADGKTVVAGTVEFTTTSGALFRRFGVARFNANGSIDTSFGPSQTGFTTFGVGDRNNDFVSALTIGADGKIVVVGTAQMNRDGTLLPVDFAVARLLPNGDLDRTFDGDGKRTIRVKGDSRANDVALQRDGKIVVIGEDFSGEGIFSGGDVDFAIARLNPDGSLDQTFASGGKRIIGLGRHEDARAVAVDTTGGPSTNPNFGKIILAGQRSDHDGQDQYAIVRLTASGAVDNSFDGDGSFIGKFPGYSHAFVSGLTIQPDGKVVVAGHAIDNTATDDTPITLARHNTNGLIDRTFGAEGNGVAYIDFGGADTGGDVIRSANGGLIVAGTSDGRFALAGLTKDGLLDPKFDGDGKVVTDFGSAGTAFLTRMAAAPNKRIVVAGGSLFKTARYLDTGASTGHTVDVTSISTFEFESKPAGPANPSTGGRIFSQVAI